MSSFSDSLPAPIAESLAAGDRRFLLFGKSGTGKSRLVADLAAWLATQKKSCLAIDADPGAPSFGLPGAVCLGKWHGDRWQREAVEALCTLDAGRFRLPLVAAVRRLAEQVGENLFFLDAPGIVRSVTGAELLIGLVEAADIQTIVVLSHHGEKLPLANELATLNCKVVVVPPAYNARPSSSQQQSLLRSRLWEAYLGQAQTRDFPLASDLLTGTPPSRETASHWRGRQIGLLRMGRTLAMGEVLDIDQEKIRVRITDPREPPDQFLVRDCFRTEKGILSTFKAEGKAGLHPAPPPDMARAGVFEKDTDFRPLVRLGEATAILVNGVFGDPLLHLRIHNRKRSLLFDLGAGERLPARLSHQVTDIFISHAHIDHIGGFLSLMRSRIGLSHPCRIFGPPAMADRILSLLNGIHWDRIGEKGPRFEVGELHGDSLLFFALQAGKNKKIQIDERSAPAGLLIEDRDCRVKASPFEHGGILTLAYRLELAPKLNVLKKRLLQKKVPAGPWLGELKKRIIAGDRQATLFLPDGSRASAGELSDELLQIIPERKIVYATDLSDTMQNRKKLVTLAQGAKVFFCEAAFLWTDNKHAEQSGHLTARACGEIASAAGVEELVPFHFSRRYEKRRQEIEEEVRGAYSEDNRGAFR